MPLPRSRPHVFSNFVTTLDGVVSLNVKGHASGGDISGWSAEDRMVMGLLRAIADVVIIGSGTLAADRRHVWTAEAIFPGLADEYRRLRNALGKCEAPLNVVVSGSGSDRSALAGIRVRQGAGADRDDERRCGSACASRRVPESVQIRAIRGGAQRDSGARHSRRGVPDDARKRILVEGGPRLLGDFYAERPRRRAVPDARAADCRT